MDFKVAGTSEGITALQMDIKVAGITEDVFREALSQAKGARAQILENMMTAIDKPREDVGTYAPKIEQFYIDPEKIREVIGPNGKMINKIIEACDEVKIDIEDDGHVVIYHMNREAITKAANMIRDIVRVAKSVIFTKVRLYVLKIRSLCKSVPGYRWLIAYLKDLS